MIFKKKKFRLKRKDFILIILLIILAFFYFNQKKEFLTSSIEEIKYKEIENILNTPPPKIDYLNFKKGKIKKEKLNKNEILNTIKLGGEWFLSNQNESFLYYKYNLKNKTYSKERHSLREMGAMWSISKLASFLDNDKYKILAEKGFKYFEKYLKYDEKNHFYYVDINSNEIKLGYSAFLILTLIEIEHPKKENYLKGLAAGIIHQQEKSGKLKNLSIYF